MLYARSLNYWERALPVDYNVTVINSRLQQVVNAVDAGASNGFLRLLSAGNSIVSSFQLSKPSMFIGNGVATFNGLSLIDPAAVGGTAVGARVEDSNGNVVISGLIVNNSTSAPPDIILSPSNIIATGQTVALTAATITGH
jgi:hypothetical protein